MQSAHSADDPLVSRADIARLAGVTRPAVTNWERRHTDFPAPVRSGDTEYFPLEHIITWLESRTIPANARVANESASATYADRIRRNRKISCSQLSIAPAADFSPLDDTTSRRLLGELMGPLADSVRGGSSVADYLNLLFSLVLLRVCALDQWSALSHEARSMVSQEDATRLLRHVGGSVDKFLMQRGLLPGMQASLLKLQPRKYQDLTTVISLSGSTGRSVFRLLLDQYEKQVGLKSQEFFTPPSIAQLIARIVLPKKSAVKRIYDPYARGGELLATVAAAATEDLRYRVAPAICGESSYHDTLRIAGMNLALHGLPTRIETGSSAPWNEADWPRHKADLIVTNPPFNHSEGMARSRKDHEWPYGPPPPGNDNFAWLQHVLVSLDVGGRAAVLMPNNAGVSANAQERHIRMGMLEQGTVECVIALPPQLFFGTSIPVSLWILKNPEGSCDQVLFIDAGQMGMKSRGQRTLTEQDQENIKEAYRSWRVNRQRGHDHPRGEFSISVDLGRIRGHGYSLNSPDYLTGESGATQSTRMAAATDVLMDMCAKERRLRTRAILLDAEVDGLYSLLVPSPGNRLPAGWRQQPLNTLCEIQAGPSYSRLRAKERSADGVVHVVLPKHISNRRIMGSDHDKVPYEVAEKLRKFQLEADDILCIRSGTTGPSALVAESQNGWLASTNLLRLHRFVSADVHPDYLLGYLSLPHIMKWIQNRSRARTAIPSISSESLGQLPVVLPSPAEQRRIGGVLRTLDEQIMVHLELVQIAENIRVSLAEQLLEGILAVE